ncbi:MAG: signal peptidase II [Planctomycetaceae bacterium]|nr:Lipoprotein signal peptidase [Planctomycetota bacterium]NUO15810.1 signal peptidase II [Planctomycetaceae bacterium]HRJ76888.1 signal peptidase II [Planctomycetota bacterium]
MTDASNAPSPGFLARAFTQKLPFWYALVISLIADLATKAWADATVRPIAPAKIEVIPGFLAWAWAENLGAAFSIFHGKANMLSFIALAIIAGIVVFMYRATPDRRWFILGLGFAAGGAIGNLHDRVLLGHVRDFIFFDFDLPGHTWTVTLPFRDGPLRPIPQRWPIFNVADICIDIGVGLLMVITFFTKEKKPEGK